MNGKNRDRVEYRELFRLTEPIEVWTPRGVYRAPSLIDLNKMPTDMDLSESIFEANRRDPKQRVLTSGELYQIRNSLENDNPDLERDMTTGPYEGTSTILDYVHGSKKRRFFYGLLVQMPELDDKGEFKKERDGVIKGKHILQMALPIKSDYVKRMDTIFDPFIDVVYGVNNAREYVHDDAFIYASSGGIKNIIHGSWGWPEESRRYSINADWNTFQKHEFVAARAGVDNGIIYELEESDYTLALDLLEKAKDVPAGMVVDSIEDAKVILSRAIKKKRKT